MENRQKSLCLSELSGKHAFSTFLSSSAFEMTDMAGGRMISDPDSYNYHFETIPSCLRILSSVLLPSSDPSRPPSIHPWAFTHGVLPGTPSKIPAAMPIQTILPRLEGASSLLVLLFSLMETWADLRFGICLQGTVAGCTGRSCCTPGQGARRLLSLQGTAPLNASH